MKACVPALKVCASLVENLLFLGVSGGRKACVPAWWVWASWVEKLVCLMGRKGYVFRGIEKLVCQVGENACVSGQ
jgi:hypothetical protein